MALLVVAAVALFAGGFALARAVQKDETLPTAAPKIVPATAAPRTSNLDRAPSLPTPVRKPSGGGSAGAPTPATPQPAATTPTPSAQPAFHARRSSGGSGSTTKQQQHQSTGTTKTPPPPPPATTTPQGPG